VGQIKLPVIRRYTVKTIFKHHHILFIILSLCVLILASCGGGGGGGGVDEDTEPDQWGSPSTGENGIPIFWARLGGNAYSGAASILETSDHGFIAAGFRQADGSNAATGAVVKVNGNGAILWEKEYADIILNCIRKTSDGGYVAGGVHRSTTNKSDPGTFMVLRMDADGNALTGWPKWDYKASYSGGATSVCESKDGSGNPDGFVFVGNVMNQEGNDQVFYAAKINLDGVLQWEKTYTAKKFGTDVAMSIVSDDSQGFIISGTEGNPDDEVWVNRINANGESLQGWPKYYGPGAATSVKKTPDGGFIVVGNTFSDSFNDFRYNDLLVIKVNAQGTVDWKRSFGVASTGDAGGDVDLCSDGGYIIAGATDSYDPLGSNPASEVYLIRLDSSGNPLWQKVKGRAPNSFESASSIVAASDGGFAIAGQAAGSFMIAKTDRSGNTISLGENDYTMTVTSTLGTINPANAASLAGRSVNTINQSTLVGGFGLDTLIKVRDNPALNGTGGLTISPAPTSIPAGGPYEITMNNYTTSYSGNTVTLTGTMTVLITSCSGTLAAGGTYTAELTESAINVIAKDSEDLETTFAGELLLHREASGTSVVQRATNTPDSTLSITGDGVTITLSTFWNITSTNLSTGAYSISTGNPVIYQVSGISGNLSLYVFPPIMGTDPIRPSTGNAEITAEDNSTVKMTVSTGGNVKLEVDTDADGTIDSTILTSFDDLF
jgi:hypothetical protein